MDAEYLHAKLERIRDLAAHACATDGYWTGDAAGKRQVEGDNVRSGRLSWLAAKRNADSGLAAVDSGHLDHATLCLIEAQSHALIALAAAVGARGIEYLNSDAGRRGAPSRTEERNRRLAEAVAKQEARGLRGADARKAALKADPTLEQAFKNVSDEGIRKAVTRGRAEINS